MTIDPTTDLGRLRLRCGDLSDLPFLPDAVYTQTLADCGNSLPRAAKQCAMYILGMLTSRTHRKLSNIEVWGAEFYNQYRDFLILTYTNPNFFDLAPIPYSSSGTGLNPLIQFAADWNKNYYTGTQSQRLAVDAAISPNDGSLFGNLNLTGATGVSSGWALNVVP